MIDNSQYESIKIELDGISTNIHKKDLLREVVNYVKEFLDSENIENIVILLQKNKLNDLPKR